MLYYPQTLNMLPNKLIRRSSILCLSEINFENKFLLPSFELWLGERGYSLILKLITSLKKLSLRRPSQKKHSFIGLHKQKTFSR